VSTRCDAVVIGRSLPALFAARDLAEVGLRVVIVAAAPQLPSGSVRDPDGVIAAAMERAAAPLRPNDAAELSLLPQQIAPVLPLLRDTAGVWAPQDQPSMLGIPGTPLTVTSQRLLGSGAAFRAQLDRLIPVLTIGKARLLGPLVRRRLGDTTRRRVLEPLVRERYGVSSDEVDVAVAAPGLNELIARCGSLTGAVIAYAERHVARETEIATVDGWDAWAEQFLRRLANFDVEVLDQHVIEVQAREEDEGWRVRFSDEQWISARAVIYEPAEAARQLGEHEIVTEAAALVTPRHRVHASTDIYDSGVGTIAPGVSLDGDWTARVWADRVVLRGPATAGGADDATTPPTPSELDRRLATLGMQRQDTAEWCIAAEPAPFATIADRESAGSRRLAFRATHPNLLPLGTALTGGDTAAAVAASHVDAVQLRRQLLGLAE